MTLPGSSRKCFVSLAAYCRSCFDVARVLNVVRCFDVDIVVVIIYHCMYSVDK